MNRMAGVGLPRKRLLSFVALGLALLAGSLASIAFVSQDIDDVLIALGSLVSAVAVLYILIATGHRLAAQALAAIQGAVWFLLLIHGGWGLVFGPIAWIAAAIAGWFPVIAAALLVAPVIVLSISWWPILTEGAAITDPLAFAALVGPATVAAALLLVPQGGTRSRRSAPSRMTSAPWSEDG